MSRNQHALLQESIASLVVKYHQIAYIWSKPKMCISLQQSCYWDADLEMQMLQSHLLLLG